MKLIIFCLFFAGFMLLGRAAWATPAGHPSPVQQYEHGVECVGYYDFGLSMMPASATNRATVQALREDWLNYAKNAKSTPDNVVKMDVSKAQDEVKNIAMSGDRQKIGTYMTALNSRCETLPLNPSDPSSSNPFGFEKNSDMKTYVAAMQCAGKYITGEPSPTGGADGTVTQGFKRMARNAKPNISDKMFKEDLVSATSKSINILATSDLNEFAALKAQCETALPFLK